MVVEWCQINDVQQQTCACQMAQKTDTQSLSLGRARNESWDVRNYKTAMRFDTDYAQIRVQGGEWIVCYFRFGRGYLAY